MPVGRVDTSANRDVEAAEKDARAQRRTEDDRRARDAQAQAQARTDEAAQRGVVDVTA